MMRQDRFRPGPGGLIAPGTAVGFALLMMWLSPLYERMFGTAMPAFTRSFLRFYPLWLALSTLALALALVGAQFPLATRWPALWRALDIALSVAVVGVIACGVIALFLPLLLRPMPA